MRKYIALGFLVLGLLMLGCTLPGSEGSGGEVQTNTTPGGNGGGQTTNTSDNGSNGDQGGETLDLDGIGYEDLIALSVPVECEYRGTQQGITTTMIYKFKNGKVRGDGYAGGAVGSSPSVSFIALEDFTYVKLPSQYGGCDWVKSPTGPTTEGNTTTETNFTFGETPMENYQSPDAVFDCRPGTFGDDVFVPSGTVCTVEEMMAGLSEDTPSTIPSPCEALEEADEEAACKQACDSLPQSEKFECVSAFFRD